MGSEAARISTGGRAVLPSQNQTYTHDAWNRLVLAESDATNVDREINDYNRLQKKA